MTSLALWILPHLALMHSPVGGTSIELPVKMGMLFDIAAYPKELFQEPQSLGSGQGPERHPPTESSDRVGASPYGDLHAGFHSSY